MDPARRPSDPRLAQSLPTGAFPAPGGGRRPSERTRGPDALGPWTLLGELGRGNFGVVYRARREGWPDEVALKVMPDALRAGPELAARFRQEARLGQRLVHPAIVRVLDQGEAGSHAWFAMELCRGETLAQRLRRGPLPAREAARLVATLARAVAYAHGHHVIHRDLKPANVMLEPGGPRVTDFGLARDEARAAALTRTGDVLGTPLYMAPEQLTGGPIDGRIDVWSLGVILFECVAGQRPFASADPPTLARRITQQDAPLLREVAPDAPPALEAIVRRALARDPAERWPDAGALADALEGLAAPTAAPTAAARPRRRRRRRVVALAAAALAAVALAAVAGARALRRAEAARALEALAAAPVGGDDAALRAAAREAAAGDPALLARVAALAAGRDADAAVAALEAALTRGDLAAMDAAAAAVRALAPDAPALACVEALAALEAAAGAGDAGAVREALVRARPRGPWAAALGAARARALEAALAAVDRTDLPVEVALARLEVARALAGGDDALARRVGAARAWLLHRRGRYGEAVAEGAAVVPPTGPLDEVAASALLAVARSLHEDPAGIVVRLERLVSAAPEPWRAVAEAELALARVRDLPTLERAEALARAALARAPGLPLALELVARVAMRRAGATPDPALLQAADEAFARAVEADPGDVHALMFRALSRFHLGDAEGKEGVLGRVIALTEPVPYHRALVWRAHTRFGLGRPGEALADLERALEGRPDDVEALLWRALCWQRLGRAEQARAEWRRLVDAAPDRVDAHLSGRGATVDVAPLRQALVEVLVAAAPRHPPPTDALPGPLVEALTELTRRAHAGAPWEELEPPLVDAEAAAGDDALLRDMVRMERARVLFRRGRLEEARALARAVAERAVSPRGAGEARYLEAFTFLWGGDEARGRDLLGRLHRDDLGLPSYAAGLTWRAYAGHHALGEALGRAAMALEPHAVEPLIGLADCLGRLGRAEEGLRAIDEALRRAPDHPRAHMARSILLTGLQRLEEAERALDVVVRLGEPAPVLRALRERAQVRLSLGRPGPAHDDLERLLARAPDDVDALCARATARLLLGRPDAAEDLRRALALDRARVEAWLDRLPPPLRERLAQLRY
ncbi:MAG: protein kinase [Planctomycetes bacterium]|nr:protein kinase [Planctomycetota bacterium]